MDNLKLFFDDGSLIPIDLDSFLNQIPDPSTPNVFLDAAAASPSESEGSWMEKIEKMLMEDEDDGLGVAAAADDGGKEVCGRFLMDMIADSPAEGGSGSCDLVDGSSCDDKEGAEEDGVVKGEAVGDGESDDPLSKKKRRQLKNRDSAARSRERKKVYMKELEIKSKYLESECLRLGRLLQCVVAENQALRSSLHYSGAYATSVTKQESAVLLLESLLLGSLLWSLGVMCLFNLSLSIQPVLDVAPLVNAGKRGPGMTAPRGARSEKLRLFLSWSFFTSRKCKASRTKIKPDLVAAQVLH